MIYAPSRFVFLHIPRTGGRAVFDALVRACLVDGVPFIADATQGRHSRTLAESQASDWESIYRFAIWRPTEERVESWVRLVQRDRDNGVADWFDCPAEWKEWLELPASEVSSKARWWFEQHEGRDFWEARGVDLIPYRQLHYRWPEICERCRVSTSPLGWIE